MNKHKKADDLCMCVLGQCVGTLVGVILGMALFLS